MDLVVNCDPCSFFVDDVTIAKLRTRPKPKPKVVNEEEPRNKFPDEDASGNFNILPLYNSSQTTLILKDQLSIETNPFLKLRWENFKKNVPKKTLILEVVNNRKRAVSPVRRMILNGQSRLYNSTELYPVPVYRNRTGTRESRKYKQENRESVSSSYNGESSETGNNQGITF